MARMLAVIETIRVQVGYTPTRRQTGQQNPPKRDRNRIL